MLGIEIYITVLLCSQNGLIKWMFYLIKHKQNAITKLCTPYIPNLYRYVCYL